ncbi:MAG: DoxX family membrane protein [Armatimonadetes bacterium]|nr:DoxX family membrane protein [Armatimonadota bacterium]
MSLRETSGSGQGIPPTSPQGKERSKLGKVLHGFLTALTTLLRVLVGFVLLSAGFTWLMRSDPGGELASTLSTQLERGTPIAFYAPFLEGVALPNADLFAALVGFGEVLAGISLLLGLASRLGAAGAVFLFINYGLMGGVPGLISQGIMIVIVIGQALWNSGRRFGLDYWTYRKWPNARIW